MSSLRAVVRRVSVAFARRSVAPRRVAVRLGAAVGLTAATAATTTTSSHGPSVAVTNSRDRSVAHVSSATQATASAKKAHWAADADGINAEQRAAAKITSSDPIERLNSAGTREHLQAAYEVPGIVRATLARDDSAADAAVLAVATATTEERAFLKKMEQEYGADVLPILRRQEWSVNLATSSTARTSDAAATLVCYFQEGTQRILWKRLSLA